jgi:membrane protein YdbS with pleckstrin-like domain
LKISKRLIVFTVISVQSLLILLLIGLISNLLISVYHLFVPQKTESMVGTAVWVTVVFVSVFVSVTFLNYQYRGIKS